MAQHLLMYGELKSRDFEEILDEDLRTSLETRLRDVGLHLVHNAYRNSYGVRLVDEPNPLREQELLSNVPLNNDHATMIAILWIKLLGPKRVTGNQSTPQTAGNGSTPQHDSVHVNAIAEEFKTFFSKARIEGILTTLAKAGLITRAADWIQAGRNLESAVDGSHMSALIRDSVTLMEVLERAKTNVAKNVGLSDTDKVAQFLQEAGTALTTAQIQQATDVQAAKAAAALRKLRKQALVTAVGDKPPLRYQWTGE